MDIKSTDAIQQSTTKEVIWHVYILKCSDDTLYTGITTDLHRRLNEHNGQSTRLGARYTQSRRPVELIYSEHAINRQQATRRELEIKSLTREQKLELINQP